MKTDTLERNEPTISRQIEFPTKIYQKADDLLVEENKRLDLVTRKDKIHLKDFLHVLVGDGIKFRKGEVYTPSDLVRVFAKNSNWVKLKAKAEAAVQELLEFQNELMKKE